MPQVLKDLFSSEKGLIAIILLVIIGVLTALGKMTVAEFRSTATWLFGIYAGAKALQGGAAAFASSGKVTHASAAPQSVAPPSAAPPPPPADAK